MVFSSLSPSTCFTIRAPKTMRAGLLPAPLCRFFTRLLYFFSILMAFYCIMSAICSKWSAMASAPACIRLWRDPLP